ncbi:MAG: YggT family protein [Anaerolineaceae bacterium]|nr:MAG: YggT family protein [Anaerolineaceae bacterium]
MFIDILIRIINFSASLLILLIFVHIALSFFVDPYHPVRQTLERIVGPLLNPIRRAVPLIGMFDISPIILVLLISVLQSALVNLLFTLR